jgi:thiamine monophosphate synthase
VLFVAADAIAVVSAIVVADEPGAAAECFIRLYG